MLRPHSELVKDKALITRHFQAGKKKSFSVSSQKSAIKSEGIKKFFCQTPKKFANWLVRGISKKTFLLVGYSPRTPLTTP